MEIQRTLFLVFINFTLSQCVMIESIFGKIIVVSIYFTLSESVESNVFFVDIV